METIRFGVSDFIAVTNQTLEYSYGKVEVVGEVQGFKINQNKYVFFDLKDEAASLSCFMMVWQLRSPLEDGMKIVVGATPKLTKWGKFSLTVQSFQPMGEGSLKRGFELLKSKLATEGLFAPERKRLLPALPARIGVISSTGAAGYADFIAILGERWGGMTIQVAQVTVQGAGSAEQIIKALAHFNQADQPPEVIALLRGGGSLDDLASFNDEPLIRALAASRVPIIAGIGHETDVTLADMVADVRAATPSNAAQLLVPDRREIAAKLDTTLLQTLSLVERRQQDSGQQLSTGGQTIERAITSRLQHYKQRLESLGQTLSQLDPKTVLRRGYALVRLENGRLVDKNVSKNQRLTIDIKDAIITAGVQHVRAKKTP